MTQNQEESLRLGIRNSFFHVTDKNEEAEMRRLRRVQSESSLPSSSSTSLSEASSSHGLLLGPQVRFPTAAVQIQNDIDHTVFSDNSGSSSSNTAGFSDNSPLHIRSEHHMPAWVQQKAGMSFDRTGPRGTGPQASGGYPLGSSEGEDSSGFHLLRGAELHSIGQCSPCGWFWGKKGCANQKECRFCHVSTHESDQKKTTASRKQYRREKALRLLGSQGDAAPEGSSTAERAKIVAGFKAQGGNRNGVQSGTQASSAAGQPKGPQQKGTFSL